MLAGNYVPEWPPIAARTGRALRPCWPGKMAICISSFYSLKLAAVLKSWDYVYIF